MLTIAGGIILAILFLVFLPLILRVAARLALPAIGFGIGVLIGAGNSPEAMIGIGVGGAIVGAWANTGFKNFDFGGW